MLYIGLYRLKMLFCHPLFPEHRCYFIYVVYKVFLKIGNELGLGMKKWFVEGKAWEWKKLGMKLGMKPEFLGKIAEKAEKKSFER